MSDIKVLWVEDSVQDVALYQDFIERAWRKHRPDIGITIEVVGTPRDARRRLSEAEFHIVLVDIYFNRESGKRLNLGSDLIAELAARRKWAIMGLTAENDAQLQREIRAAGAYDVFFKEELLKPDKLEVFGEALWKALSAAGQDAHLVDARIDMRTMTTPLRALVSMIGRGALVRLVSELVDAPLQDITIRMVRGGYSGAVILHVTARVAAASERPNREMLVKCSRSLGSLNRELAYREHTRSVQAFVPIFNEEPVEANGWYAIAANFVWQAVTLQEWLTRRVPDGKSVAAALGKVFSDAGLQGLANTRPAPVADASALAVLQMLGASNPDRGLARRSRILLAIEEFEKVCAHEFGPVTRLRAFLDNGVIGDHQVNSRHRAPPMVLGHGDLHSRNILVDSIGNPYLIDGGHIGFIHWALDEARLLSSLALDCVVPGVEAHRWEGFRAWLDLGNAVLEGDLDGVATSLPEADSGGVRDALLWMMSRSRERDRERFPEWEWLVALGTEFGRGSYRIELPGPKRVFALAMAEAALDRAAGLMTSDEEGTGGR